LLKASEAQATDTSPKTIWGITNCMIGSAMIIYPILFAKSGLIISTLVMVIVATIQYLTCRLLVIHNRPD
jgi:amino acid permease